jgi:hypothetical protein
MPRHPVPDPANEADFANFANFANVATGTVPADAWAAGYRLTPPLLDPPTCRRLAAAFDDDEAFRTTVDMASHRYGEGRYRYFRYPLPPVVAKLRAQLYPPLATVANGWLETLGLEPRYPASLDVYLQRCRDQQQERPTPLLLRYGTGGFNCLHQDLYGAEAFPLQATVLLSSTDDFEGGEFLLVEQRPRQQSRGTAVRLEQGQAILFPNSWRPVSGGRGWYRAAVRHGVSTIRSGTRVTLGLIFHDAA